tara:strand:- start:12560 stop:14224 length:1665 start_codon:yes stop_codon:yes gene_type:complete
MPSRGRPKKDPNAPKQSYNVSSLERAKRATRKKLAAERKQAEKAAKKVQKHRQNAKRIENTAKNLTNGTSKVVDLGDELNSLQPVSDLVEDQEVIFRPNNGPQEEFLSSSEEDVLYGGAAGGGKSFALLVDPLRYCHNPNHRGLLLRRTLDELTELIDKSRQLYVKAFPKAIFRESKSTWVFPSGATMWFTYLDRDKDVTRFQGQAFNWIGIDEITQYPTPYVWDYLRSRLRTTDDELRPYMSMRCTGNPGGVGGWWIKKMYVDPHPSNEAFPATDIETNRQLLYPEGHEKARQPLFYRKFIPARLTDNPYLMQDGRYEAMLRSLPEVERKRLLEGDWDVAEGAAFPEFSKVKHVVDPFEMPTNWPRIRAADYGYASPSCVLWGAIDWDNNIWIYRELYVKQHTAEQLADRISELEQLDPKPHYTVLDSSCWNKTGFGPSIAETMMRLGVRWTPSDRNRLQGKMEIHRRLADNPLTKLPRIRIFNTCNNTIRQLAGIPLSKSNSEDVDTKAEDHAYDALRYLVMTRMSGHASIHKSLQHIKEQTYQPMNSTFGY